MSIAVHSDSGEGFFGGKSNVAVYWFFGAAFALLAAGFYLAGTRFGIGVLPDSIRYFNIGWIAFDAPGYAWFLEALKLTGLPIEDAAWLGGLILVVVNTILVWHILTVATGRLTYSVAGTALVLASPQFVSLHLLALSEPLFIALILASLALFFEYVVRERFIWLVACSVALGLAALTRFTAPPLGGAMALCLLLMHGRPMRQRLRDALAVGLISGGIFFGWMALSLLFVGRATGRPLEFLGNLDADRWAATLDAATALIVTVKVPLVPRVLLCAATLAASVFLVVRVARRAFDTAPVKAQGALVVVLGLFVLGYVGFLILSTYVEANLTLNGRYLLPGYVAAVLLVTIALSSFDDRQGSRLDRALTYGFAALALVMLVGHSSRSATRVLDAWQNGVGFAHRDWRESPAMEAVARLPAAAPIFSNAPDPIRYNLRRQADLIPQLFDLRTGRPDPGNPFEKQLVDLDARFKAGPTFVVFLDRLDWRFYLVTEADLVARLGLVKILDTADGRIYSRGAGLGRGAVDDPVTSSAAVSGGRPGATSSQFSQ